MADNEAEFKLRISAENAGAAKEVEKLDASLKQVAETTRQAGAEAAALQAQMRRAASGSGGTDNFVIEREPSRSWEEALDDMEARIRQAQANRETAIEQDLHNIEEAAEAAAEELDEVQRRAPGQAASRPPAAPPTPPRPPEPPAPDPAQNRGRLNRLRQQFDSFFQFLGPRAAAAGRAVRLALFNPLSAGFAALAATAAAAFKGITSFAREELSQLNLDQALASRGKLSEGLRQEFSELANEQERLTAIGNEAFQDVIAQIVKLTGQTDGMADHIEHVKQLAGILGGGEGSLKQAALLVSKVINGNTGALSEYGIQVDSTLPKAERIEQVWKQIAGGAGQLEARTKTLSGSWAALRINVSNIFEGFGNLISRTGILQAGMGALNAVMGGLAAILPQTAAKVPGLTNVLRPLAASAEEAEKTLNELKDEAANMDHRQAIQANDDLAASLAAIRDRAREASEEIARQGERERREIDGPWRWPRLSPMW